MEAFRRWSEDHPEVEKRLQELSSIIQKESWNRLEPMVIELPKDATAEEEKLARLTEREVRRKFELRTKHADLIPREFQDIVAEDEELAKLNEEIGKLHIAVQKTALAREIRRLKKFVESD